MDSHLIAKLTDSEVVGICVKSLDGTVLSQNKTCKKVCGDQKSKICVDKCMALYQKEELGRSPIGTQVFRGQCSDGQHYDTIMLNDGEQLITLLCLLNKKIETDLEYFKQFDLSKRELEVVQLVLRDFTNKEIMEKLFISKPTIKTHLNNIYRKIPDHMITLLRKKP